MCANIQIIISILRVLTTFILRGIEDLLLFEFRHRIVLPLTIRCLSADNVAIVYLGFHIFIYIFVADMN